MTVKSLIEKLEQMPAEALIVTQGADHGFITAEVCQGQAAARDGEVWEYHPDYPHLYDEAKIIPIVIIG